MKLLDRHVLRSHLLPFLLGFSVITGVLFLEVFKDFLDDFLAKGVSPLTITEVLVLSLGHTLALSIPMAVLVATLLAFGQLAADNELTAFKAAGVHLYRIMLPVVLAAGLVTVAMIAYNDRVLPESNHRLAGLTADIGRKRPTVSIEPGRFIDQFKGYQLLIGDKDEATDEIRDVQVWVLRQGRSPDLIVAPRGQLQFVDGGNTLRIDLYDGEMHALPQGASAEEPTYRVTRFTEHTVLITDIGSTLQRTEREYRSDREMSIAMMRDAIADKRRQIAQVRARFGDPARRRAELVLGLLEPQARAEYFARHRPPPPGRLTLGSEDRLRDEARVESSSLSGYALQIRQLQVEIHKKYAIPVACVVFVLLGAPLAIRSGRGGMATAITFSILCFFVYYLFLTGGEKLADRRMLSPAAAMWAANVVFGALGLWLTWRASIESSPIHWLSADPRRWMRRRRPAPPAAAPAAGPRAV
jgi:lipopolysaccharide export system permease protein